MKTYILLLRGINVGGHRKLLMADLKDLLANLGLLNVQTYIQSGNVVFQTKQSIDVEAFEDKVGQSIHDIYGYDVSIIILSFEKLKSIIKSNPFVNGNDIKDLHCTFFKRKPQNDLLNAFNALDFEPDSFLGTNEVVYLLCGLKYTDTKLTHTLLEKKLKVPCTTRNWKTTIKLLEMAQAMAS